MNQPDTKPSTAGEQRGSMSEGDRTRQTPATDMQAEDAGTENSADSGRGTAASSVLKQTDKTAAETGTRR